ncbi:MAG TPA: hypothetical protein VGK89_02025 [Candidatus Eisenbacteria bacterium]
MYAIYFRHWFQRAVRRQTTARHLHHYFGKISDGLKEAENQQKMQAQYYQPWHLSQCVTWLKELVDSEARVSELENPPLEMEIRDKIKSAYSTAYWQQQNYKPAQLPFVPEGSPTSLLPAGISSLGTMPFLTAIGDLYTLRRKLDAYRGPLFLQWFPRRSRSRGVRR